MSFFNRLTVVALSAVLIGPGMSLGAARARKTNPDFAQGRALEDKKDWDGALAAYQKALSQDPSNLEFQMAIQKARFESAQAHVEKGVKLRVQGMLGEAMLEFQRAFAINPASGVAVQEVRTTQEMIQRERDRVMKTGKESSPEDRGLTPMELLKKQTDDRLDRMQPVPELKPLGPERFDLKINSNIPRTLFETLGGYVGINVLWDSDYASGANSYTTPIKNGNVNFQNSTIGEALDYLAILTKSFWKPLSSNTIFITQDTRAKRTDYADQVMKVFYLSNIQGQQDLNDIMTAVRTVADVQRLMPLTSQNAIVARADADSMAVIEKIIHDLDRPKAEVMVDVIVMQTSSDHSRQLASALASTGLNVPFNFTPPNGLQVAASSTATGTTTATTGTTTGTAIPLSSLGHLASADWSTTLPGALLQAVMTDADTKVLQSPQVRSLDNLKATLKVGNRIPTATGSFQPGVGGVAGLNPLVNTQFNYTEVGVNVDLTPRVHDNGDVSMLLDLDVSDQSGTVNLGGITQPVFSQKHFIYQLRMREGEIGLMGGLINVQDTKTVTGIPGLSSIPLLRRLFTGESTDHQRTELMIAVVPHVIRRPEYSAESLRAIAVGTQNVIHVTYAPKTGDDAPPPARVGQSRLESPPAPAAPPPAAAAPTAVSPAPSPLPGPTAPGAPPLGALPFPLQQLTRPAAGAPPGAAAAPQPVAPATARFTPIAFEASLNGSFTANLVLDSGADVASASPLQIQYDPKVLNLADVSPGDLFTRDSAEPVFSRDIQNDQGLATIKIARPAGAAGAAGPGTLITLSFQAVGRGSTTVRALNVTVRNSQAMSIGSSSPQLSVNVK